MTSPALSVAYSFWLKARWLFVLSLGTIALFAVASLTMAWAREYLLAAYLNVMLFDLALVLNAFVYGATDFDSRASMFPAHMLVLPATTRQLVAWPMLFCAAFFAAMWMLTAGLLLRPAGIHPPLVWPATAMAAGAVWIQAVSWTQFPTPLARVPAIVLAIVPLMLLGILAGLNEHNSALLMLVAAGNLAWLLIAYCVGVNGLARVRAGKQSDLLALNWKWRGITVDSAFTSSARRLKPFRSPFAAQLWYEYRRNMRTLPFLLLMVGVPMAPLLCMPIFDRTASGLMIGSTTVSPSALGLGVLISFPVMISVTGSASFAMFDSRGKPQMSSFFATRPMATATYIAVKLLAAAIVALACWAIVLTLVGIWAALEASPLNRHHSLIRGLLAQATPRSIAAALLGLIALLFFTWRNLVSGMWPVLLGRKSIANSIGFAALGLMLLAGLGGWWIVLHPTVQPLAIELALWLCAVGLAIKFGITYIVLQSLVQRQLVRPITAARWLFGWCASALVVFAVVCCFIAPSWFIAFAVLFALPLDAIALAPLTLYWNRHR